MAAREELRKHTNCLHWHEDEKVCSHCRNIFWKESVEQEPSSFSFPLSSMFLDPWLRDCFCKKVLSDGEFSWWRWKMVKGSLLDRPGKADLEFPCVSQSSPSCLLLPCNIGGWTSDTRLAMRSWDLCHSKDGKLGTSLQHSISSQGMAGAGLGQRDSLIFLRVLHDEYELWPTYFLLFRKILGTLFSDGDPNLRDEMLESGCEAYLNHTSWISHSIHVTAICLLYNSL